MSLELIHNMVISRQYFLPLFSWVNTRSNGADYARIVRNFYSVIENVIKLWYPIFIQFEYSTIIEIRLQHNVTLKFQYPQLLL